MMPTSLAERIEGFRQEAARGEPVYVTDVGEAFARDPHTVEVGVRLDSSDREQPRWFALRLPLVDEAAPERRAFVRSYLEARVYNILSTYGGRRLAFCLSPCPPELRAMLASLDESFGIGLAKRNRRGYGRCVNVAERMTDAMDGVARPTASFCFQIEGKRPPAAAELAARPVELGDVLRALPARLDGRSVVGMDVGGTDIKIAVCVDHKLVAFKEYDWFPALFRRSSQLIAPVLLLARWARARAAVERVADAASRISLGSRLDAVGSASADDDDIRGAVADIEKKLGDRALRGLDAFGMCFPDVVVRNRIVGGEVYKTRGIRNNPELDYEADFNQITNLDQQLAAFCKPTGSFRNINDGPMAAFTAALERAVTRRGRVEEGILAFTLGTELGTGWLDEEGRLPQIPLEVYNYIIDLGSRPERAFGPDDPRSINNFNTGLPGTLQKYVCQSGVFRLALKAFAEHDPARSERLFREGYLVHQGNEVAIAASPRDMRKPLLERLMQEAAAGDALMGGVFRQIGEYLAVTCRETQDTLGVRVMRPVLFGRVVKETACIRLIREGAARRSPDLVLEVADEGLAGTPLMMQLRDGGRYSVAQFAQAVGAAYFSLYQEQL